MLLLDKDNVIIVSSAISAPEIAELAGIYLLEQVGVFLGTVGAGCHAGLYGNDGLICVGDSNGPLLNGVGGPASGFQRPPFDRSCGTGGRGGGFLDFTVSADGGSYKPYRKPSGRVSCVSGASNHPPLVLKSMPGSVQERLATISGSGREFLEAGDEYREALENAGCTEILRCGPDDNSPRPRKGNVGAKGVWLGTTPRAAEMWPLASERSSSASCVCISRLGTLSAGFSVGVQ